MAIDDNTIYGLYGSQIKDLPEKINAVKGKAKELTSADYNWHSTGDVDDRIAAWLLPDGLYVVKNSPAVWFTTSNNDSNLTFVKGTNSVGFPYLLTINNAGTVAQYTLRSNGSTMNVRPILKQSDIVDNLTSTSTTTPLSANQGKVLKDFIGDLTNLTTTDKTNLVAAINEAAAGGGGPTVVQTTGTSTTDVMSQSAVTSMVFADPATQYKIKIGAGTSSSEGANGVEIGRNASAGEEGVALGYGTYASYKCIALGHNADARGAGAVAIGDNCNVSGAGIVGIGTILPSSGYNSSNYRLLTGLYDPQSAHDAATKGYVDTSLGGLTLLTISQTDYDNLQTYDPNTLYIITGA